MQLQYDINLEYVCVLFVNNSLFSLFPTLNLFPYQTVHDIIRLEH